MFIRLYVKRNAVICFTAVTEVAIKLLSYYLVRKMKLMFQCKRVSFFDFQIFLHQETHYFCIMAETSSS